VGPPQTAQGANPKTSDVGKTPKGPKLAADWSRRPETDEDSRKRDGRSTPREILRRLPGEKETQEIRESTKTAQPFG